MTTPLNTGTPYHHSSRRRICSFCFHITEHRRVIVSHSHKKISTTSKTQKICFETYCTVDTVFFLLLVRRPAMKTSLHSGLKTTILPHDIYILFFWFANLSHIRNPLTFHSTAGFLFSRYFSFVYHIQPFFSSPTPFFFSQITLTRINPPLPGGGGQMHILQ